MKFGWSRKYVLVLAAVMGSATLVSAQSPVGTWKTTVSPQGIPSFTAYDSFHLDGTSTEIDNSNSPGAQTIAQGPWVKLNEHQFAFTETNQLFDGGGNYIGIFEVTARCTMNGANAYTANFVYKVKDDNGNILAEGTGTASGQRVRLDSATLNTIP